MRVEITRERGVLSRLFGEEYSAYYDGELAFGRSEEKAIEKLKKKLQEKREDNYSVEINDEA